MIKYLGYSSIEIITKIQPRTLVEYKVWIDLLPTQLKILTNK